MLVVYALLAAPVSAMGNRLIEIASPGDDLGGDWTQLTGLLK